LKDNFASYWILCWSFLSFTSLTISQCTYLVCCCWESSDIIPFLAPLRFRLLYSTPRSLLSRFSVSFLSFFFFCYSLKELLSHFHLFIYCCIGGTLWHL
jgi:hypothetical protein